MFWIANRTINVFMKGTLRSPLRRLFHKSVLILHYKGIRTEKEYSLPVMYAKSEKYLIVVVGLAETKKWWRNFRGGHSVSVEWQGEKYDTTGALSQEVTEDSKRALQAYFEKFPRSGRSIARIKRGEEISDSSLAKAVEESTIVLIDLPTELIDQLP